MSRKPLKKSDMGKSWMKPRREFRQIISPEYHLIVTEGTETEPQYFQAIKKTIDAEYRNRIHLDITGKGNNTVSLFNRAVKDVAHSSNIYKHVWLVYDADDFPPERQKTGTNQPETDAWQIRSWHYGSLSSRNTEAISVRPKALRTGILINNILPVRRGTAFRI